MVCDNNVTLFTFSFVIEVATFVEEFATSTETCIRAACNILPILLQDKGLKIKTAVLFGILRDLESHS